MTTVNSYHFVLLHGTGGSPESNWLPWLARRLREHGAKVSLPAFPTGEGQNLENWRRAFAEQIGPLEPAMVLIGHSMGAGAALRFVEAGGTKIRALFLVAGWEGLLGLPEFDPLISSFFLEPLDCARIRSLCGDCRMYHGDDDPYVPLALGEALRARLAADLTVIPGGKHLNAAAGFTLFPLLLEDILRL